MLIMLTLIYGFVLVASSFTLGLFGFFVGRCARKMPVIDDNLPWTLHRGQVVQSKRRALG
jgi:hypothetical protein